MRLLNSVISEELIESYIHPVLKISKAVLVRVTSQVNFTYPIVPHWNFNLAAQTIDSLVPAGALGQFQHRHSLD